MKYYYIMFFDPAGPGCTVVQANPSENGFNIADAHRYLKECYGGMVVIIQHWQEINEHRYNEMKAFIANVQGAAARGSGPSLTMVQGGKHEQGSEPTPGGSTTPGVSDQEGPRQGGFKPTLVNLDHGSREGAELRSEEISCPQLEKGLPTDEGPSGGS